MPIDFTLPELGENIVDGDVLRVLVKPGDTLAKDQPVLELETDKATIEVPSSVEGRIKDVKIKAGDKVKVGQAILSVDDGAQTPATAEAAAAPTPPPGDSSATVARPFSASAKATADHRTLGEGGQDRDRAAESPTLQPAQQPEAVKVVDISRGARPPAEPASPPSPAAPSVRRAARELGVDIDRVPGSGPGGRISIDDVKAQAKRLVTVATQASTPSIETGGATDESAVPDFTRWGKVERQPMRAVRRKTAEHLSAAWAAIPHVTQHDLADITALEELRKRYAKSVETAGGNLTITAIAVKVVAAALRLFPQFNASIDMKAEEVIFKRFVNIGVAVDTDRGLLVPVIRDADRKNIVQISVELSELAEKARTRKIAIEEMQGGTFSISNLGGIGGTAFTPIVNLPEVAILGISRARTEPVFRDGGFVPRLMLPLSLSYDHRLIDGADGIRFVRWVAEALEQPFLLALQG